MRDSLKSTASKQVPGIDLSRRQIQAVRETVVGKLGASVLPVYLRQGSSPPKQTGSCVLLIVGDHRFLLSAAHVLDDRKLGRLQVAGKNGLVDVDGSYLRTTPDKIDLGALSLGPDSVQAIGDVPYLNPGDLDPNDTVAPGKLYLTAGYPNTRNRRIDNSSKVAYTHCYTYVGRGLPQHDCLKYGWDEKSHVLVAYVRAASVDVDGKKSVAPDPTGNSGGAVIAVDRKQLDLEPDQRQPKLVGVMIVFRRVPGIIVATRIGAIQTLISAVYPETAPLFTQARRLRFNAFQERPKT